MRKVGLSPCAIALAAAAAFGQQTPVFRVSVERVRLDALVTAGGRPLEGLTAADFDVLDNGVPQRVDVATTAGDVTMVLVLDTSGSVEGTRLEHLVAASQTVVDLLNPGDTALLITFSDRLALSTWSVRSPAAVRAALVGAQASGHTAMWDALFAGLSFASGDSGRSLVLLFTDGIENASWLTEKMVTESLKRTESVVCAVNPVIDLRQDSPAQRSQNTLSAAGRMLLWKVVEQTGGSLLEADWSEKLSQQFTSIVREFRSRYLLLYEPAGVGRDDGWHRVEVRVKSRSAKVRVRPGYYATPRGTR
jgi:VWFA-related protein